MSCSPQGCPICKVGTLPECLLQGKGQPLRLQSQFHPMKLLAGNWCMSACCCPFKSLPDSLLTLLTSPPSAVQRAPSVSASLRLCPFLSVSELALIAQQAQQSPCQTKPTRAAQLPFQLSTQGLSGTRQMRGQAAKPRRGTAGVLRST